MNELLQAAKAVIKRFSDWDCVHIDNLRIAVERAENPPAENPPADFREWYEGSGFDDSEWPAYAAWTAAQQAERERLRARAKMAAKKIWKAKDWYFFPGCSSIEQFVEELMEEDDVREQTPF